MDASTTTTHKGRGAVTESDRKPRTNAQRQAAYKARRESMGLKRVPSLWAHPEDVPAIRAYVAKLNKRRGKIDRTKEPT
jgi:hypothetical protein